MFKPYSIEHPSDIEKLKRAVAEGANVILLKKSPTCYISKTVFNRLERLWDIPTESLSLFVVDVIKQRPLSQVLEKITGVKHESPQCILFKNQSVHWFVSHHDIEFENLKLKLQE